MSCNCFPVRVLCSPGTSNGLPLFFFGSMIKNVFEVVLKQLQHHMPDKHVYTPFLEEYKGVREDYVQDEYNVFLSVSQKNHFF